MQQAVRAHAKSAIGVSGEFLTIGEERYYAIRNVDQMAPFFMSIISSSDHWLFVSSTGGLAAGRVSPETALFPYIPVDRIHESGAHTGSKTVMRVRRDLSTHLWEPFGQRHHDYYDISRNLYKNLLGNKLCFEEINHSLQLTFRYEWSTSERYGFVRHCELINTGELAVRVELVDGLRNLLPAGTPIGSQTNASNLVDAYKWSELHEGVDLGLYTLYSGITDRAEPCESLRATTVFCLGLPGREVFLSAKQLEQSISKGAARSQRHQRGIRGDYLVRSRVNLGPNTTRSWKKPIMGSSPAP